VFRNNVFSDIIPGDIFVFLFRKLVTLTKEHMPYGICHISYVPYINYLIFPSVIGTFLLLIYLGKMMSKLYIYIYVYYFGLFELGY
jgi:hypothetical protein